ncbi:YqgE/AlgH family protein [Nocardioides limicola]|uniref:YqgE/AlgH family protein n=1 Tax=Nocardioides limicola TaxID=2803368 RepID=UPI00193B1132|nr:YqgE/AlgH family protein [Nocardioides sp. DJM-14]
MSEVHAGMLLVAAPDLGDPNFARTVVLLLDVNAEGALGVVLNRPSDTPVAAVLNDWSLLVDSPAVLFVGGPVGTDGALAVATTRPGVEPVGFRPLVDGVGSVDLDTPVELVDGSLASLRIFAGYAGWGAGQLQDELARDDWYVVPALPGDLTRADTETMWSDVLRRQPGDLAWHATRPADPELN